MGAGAATDTSTGDADTTMGGTGAAVITNGVTIAAGKAFAPFAFVIPLPRRYAKW
jgi:hypothetical protein